jgi:hypothetical protein
MYTARTPCSRVCVVHLVMRPDTSEFPARSYRIEQIVHDHVYRDAGDRGFVDRTSARLIAKDQEIQAPSQSSSLRPTFDLLVR